jgi:hypothetical protein
MKDLEGYDQFGDDQFARLNQKYLASFVVTGKGQRLHFPVAYRNDSFVVYKINVPTVGVSKNL